MIKTWKNLLTT